MTTSAQKQKPWVERYRPKSLQDVAHQSEVVATLENAVLTGRLPHCLFYGPPGSGKVRIYCFPRLSFVSLVSVSVAVCVLGSDVVAAPLVDI